MEEFKFSASLCEINLYNTSQTCYQQKTIMVVEHPHVTLTRINRLKKLTWARLTFHIGPNWDRCVSKIFNFFCRGKTNWKMKISAKKHCVMTEESKFSARSQKSLQFYQHYSFPKEYKKGNEKVWVLNQIFCNLFMARLYCTRPRSLLYIELRLLFILWRHAFINFLGP